MSASVFPARAGMSQRRRAVLSQSGVFPARAGMSRAALLQLSTPQSVPRASGDEPKEEG